MTKEILKIQGGAPLEGIIKAAGAKNSITKLLVASLLSKKKCIFTNVPNIEDVKITIALCEEIGSDVTWDRDAQIIEIQTQELKTSYIPQRFSGANRIPILMIGALLGRVEDAIIVPTAGGCNIGPRPIDLHIEALKQLGAHIEHREMRKEGAYFAQAPEGLQGTTISLPFPSVGATENTILAATRAKGTTLIKNAAIEPEIIELILFLQKLGVIIFVDVDRTIRIESANQFYEVEHRIITDRIEAASFGMAAISTKGRVFVEGAEHQTMITFLNKLRKLGGGFQIKQNGIEFFYDGPLKGGLHIETEVHPGFLTDWQQPFVVLLTQGFGTSIIHETIYENRFGYAIDLKEMGADIELYKDCLGGKSCRFASKDFLHSIIVKGPTPLHAKEIAIPDLRAGFAYVLAALIAEGETTLSNLYFLDRGYENLTSKLASIGAQIERLTPQEMLKEKKSSLLSV